MKRRPFRHMTFIRWSQWEKAVNEMDQDLNSLGEQEWVEGHKQKQF